MTPADYCKSVLPKVSRTFAINIAVLNGDLYKATLCSYLIFRIIDTVEDAKFNNIAAQEKLLNLFKVLFVRKEFSKDEVQIWIASFFSGIQEKKEERAYYDLIKNTQLVIDYFLTLSESSRAAITDCVIEMSDGMVSMLARRRNTKRICFLETIKDLNDYCYYVAGTVGILSTRLFIEYSRHFKRSSLRYLSKPAVSLALGLQMTNIIKDCMGDYRRGVCYIPEDFVKRVGVNPDNLFDSDNRKKLQHVINKLVEIAANHLYDAIDSILSFSKIAFRIRLSCLWPLILAITTLIEVKKNPKKLLLGEKIKISRSVVKHLLTKTTLLCWSNRALRLFFNGYKRQLFEST